MVVGSSWYPTSAVTLLGNFHSRDDACGAVVALIRAEGEARVEAALLARHCRAERGEEIAAHQRACNSPTAMGAHDHI